MIKWTCGLLIACTVMFGISVDAMFYPVNSSWSTVVTHKQLLWGAGLFFGLGFFAGYCRQVYLRGPGMENKKKELQLMRKATVDSLGTIMRQLQKTEDDVKVFYGVTISLVEELEKVDKSKLGKEPCEFCQSVWLKFFYDLHNDKRPVSSAFLNNLSKRENL